jgi:hypothetical protein
MQVLRVIPRKQRHSGPETRFDASVVRWSAVADMWSGNRPCVWSAVHVVEMRSQRVTHRLVALCECNFAKLEHKGNQIEHGRLLGRLESEPCVSATGVSNRCQQWVSAMCVSNVCQQ